MFQPQAKDIVDPKGATTEFPTRLWPFLAAIVLGLYVVDILLRRVRLFEENSRRA